ncbi:DUF3429 domain-containing protein [Sandarakinorhabdus sp.]|uniref:DUF3429 domain-containing protein n=1 Tax=Sandarakinorhabdus sp. TaxID=1916663 RepID=UPI00333FAFE1
MTDKPPAAVLFYGFAGLIPFLAPPLLTLLWPEQRGLFEQALLWWAAIILSFLGGARWGAAVQAPAPDPRLIGLTMVPSIFAFAALLAPVELSFRMLLLITGFLLVLIWDRRSGGLPGWYGWLRERLTALAAVGLIGQLLVS